MARLEIGLLFCIRKHRRIGGLRFERAFKLRERDAGMLDAKARVFCGKQVGKRKRGASRDHGFGVIGNESLLVREAQALLENANKTRIERERPAHEHDRRPYIEALGQTAERLLCNSMKR